MTQPELVVRARDDLTDDAGWRLVLRKVHSLSARELQVFSLLAEGLSNRELSGSLRITERTAKAHVAQILIKLDVESRLQAGLVAFAWMVVQENGDHLALPAAPCDRGVAEMVADLVRSRQSLDPEQAQYRRGARGRHDHHRERRLPPREHTAH
jgi:DNA-binding CsgD family transcriptional regulator